MMNSCKIIITYLDGTRAEIPANDITGFDTSEKLFIIKTVNKNYPLPVSDKYNCFTTLYCIISAFEFGEGIAELEFDEKTEKLTDICF